MSDTTTYPVKQEVEFMTLYNRLKMYCRVKWAVFISRLKILRNRIIYYISGNEALPPPLSMRKYSYNKTGNGRFIG